MSFFYWCSNIKTLNIGIRNVWYDYGEWVLYLSSKPRESHCILMQYDMKKIPHTVRFLRRVLQEEVRGHHHTFQSKGYLPYVHYVLQQKYQNNMILVTKGKKGLNQFPYIVIIQLIFTNKIKASRQQVTSKFLHNFCVTSKLMFCNFLSYYLLMEAKIWFLVSTFSLISVRSLPLTLERAFSKSIDFVFVFLSFFCHKFLVLSKFFLTRNPSKILLLLLSMKLIVGRY